ncbi:5448_t:CDS:2, partial [Racocetra persica]
QKWKRIGHGGQGTVYSVYLNSLEESVALKILHYDIKDISSDVLMRSTLAIQKKNNLDPKTDDYYMVLQLANDGDLRSYLLKSELDWTTKIKMAKEISNGVNYIHDAELVHRDLLIAQTLLL